MEINLDEIAFERMANEKLKAYLGIVATGSVHSGILTPQERLQLQEVFTNAHRKYNLGLTDKRLELAPPVVMTIDQAREIAEHQIEAELVTRQAQITERAQIMIDRQHKRIARVNAQYQERVARINTDAGRRGLLSSTAVMVQLERAESARNEAISAHETEISFLEARLQLDLQRLDVTLGNRVEALAKRIHNESQRTAVAVVRERAMQADRNYSNWKSWQRVRLELNLDAKVQSAIEDEVFFEYKAFLLRQHPERAFQLIDNDPVFFFNLTVPQWIQMRTIMQNRR